ncbi:MAG: M15 family metallopeptidase [Clostridia bacterium]|nr:M15 family metallopeptidase [Clostridia bacterium]
MSRTARRAAARRRMHLLAGATVLGVLLILGILAVQLMGGPKDPSSDPAGFGGTDTDTVVITSTDPSPSTDSETDTSTDSSSASQTDTDTESDDPSTNTYTDTDTNSDSSDHSDYNTDDPTPGINDDGSFDFTAWNMILVNPDNPIPDDYPLKLSWVSLNGKDRQVNSLCAQAFRDMVNAAKEDGVILLLRSTYRGIELQTEGFNNKVQEYINQGYSKEKATEIAATVVAVPGTSEHHTGLAADITTPSFDRLNKDFDKTEAYQWLITHCAEYGFILRYPEDKTEITKIIYEPWHYRYVGKEAAQIIMSEGICYEEFVEKYGKQ